MTHLAPWTLAWVAAQIGLLYKLLRQTQGVIRSTSDIRDEFTKICVQLGLTKRKGDRERPRISVQPVEFFARISDATPSLTVRVHIINYERQPVALHVVSVPYFHFRGVSLWNLSAIEKSVVPSESMSVISIVRELSATECASFAGTRGGHDHQVLTRVAVIGEFKRRIFAYAPSSPATLLTGHIIKKRPRRPRAV